MTDLALPSSGRELSPAEVESWCGQIEQIVAEESDVRHITDLRDRFMPFSAAFQKASKKGSATLAATERRIETRIGELIIAAREAGDLAKHGQIGNGRVDVQGCTSTLGDLGLTRRDAAEFVTMAEEPEAVAEAIEESTDAKPATRNAVRKKVAAKRREQSSQHPATFSKRHIDAIVELLAPYEISRILDPFAGEGNVHAIADRLGADSVGVEIEPEWANLHERTIVGDSTAMTATMVGPFDCVVTSPAYGNRMADKHDAKDDSDRATYKHRLGRDLTENNGGGMQWGEDYRTLHRAVWCRVVELLQPGGLFVLNIKDHVRDGRRVPVSGWHVATLLDLGLKYVDDNGFESKGLGSAGENEHTRIGVEHVYLLAKP